MYHHCFGIKYWWHPVVVTPWLLIVVPWIIYIVYKNRIKLCYPLQKQFYKAHFFSI